MISKESIANLGLGKMLGASWVIFTTVYFLLSLALPYIVAKNEAGLLQQQNQVGFQNGQVNGYQAAIGQLGQALAGQLQGGCKEAVPVTIASGTTIGILSTNCLQQQAGAPGTPAAPQAAPQR